MAANDDFPRGAKQVLVNDADTATTITLPASPGVAHCLDSWDIYLNNSIATSSVGSQITLSTSDGVYVNYVIGVVNCPEATSTSDTTATNSDTGPYMCNPGASMTISATAVSTDTQVVLRIAWHDL